MGKWGKIIGGIGGLVAAPFTGGATLGLGASLLGAGLTSGSAGKNTIDPNTPQGQLFQTQQEAIKQSMGTAAEISPLAKGFLTDARAGFAAPVDYWSRILGGNRGAAMSLLAPQIQQIQQGGQRAGEAAMWLSPRSGTTAAGREASIYAPQQATSALLQTARPEAARNMADLASRQGALGAGSYGAVSGLLGNASRGTSDALNSLMRQNQMQYDQSKAAGAAIWDIFKSPQVAGWLQKFGGLFGGGGGGAGGYDGNM